MRAPPEYRRAARAPGVPAGPAPRLRAGAGLAERARDRAHEPGVERDTRRRCGRLGAGLELLGETEADPGDGAVIVVLGLRLLGGGVCDRWDDDDLGVAAAHADVH